MIGLGILILIIVVAVLFTLQPEQAFLTVEQRQIKGLEMQKVIYCHAGRC